MENRRESSPVIMGNQDGLFGIINNLMSHAIQFTPKSGTISVPISPQGRDAAAIWLAHTGPGMSKAQLDKLFDWVDASRDEEVYAKYGQSLGLLIAKDWVEKQNGTLEVYSEQGRGTQFKVVFPLAPDVALP